MDWPISTATRSRPADDPEESDAKFFFSTADEPSDRLGILSPFAQIKQAEPIPGPRLGRRNALLLAAAGVAGLLLYGSAVRLGSNGPISTAQRATAATGSSSLPIALPPPNLLRPISPEEATKENAERPFVARTDTPAGRFIFRADTEDRTRALTCLAQAVYYEAGGEGPDGERAVAQVVLNRLRHPGFPATVCGVVYQGADRPTGCQFSFVCDGSMQRIPVPSLWARARQIAEQALGGKVFAPIGHATHYHADYVLPYWADSLDKSVQIGRHIFYRLPSTLGDARAFSQHYNGIEPQVREPGATVALPSAAATQQLASALISDGVEEPSRDVEKAAQQPGSPLLADDARATLLADGGGAPGQSHRTKPSAECPAATEGRQLIPLGANELRASSAPTC